jgi:hypothetical protein
MIPFNKGAAGPPPAINFDNQAQQELERLYSLRDQENPFTNALSNVDSSYQAQLEQLAQQAMRNKQLGTQTLDRNSAAQQSLAGLARGPSRLAARRDLLDSIGGLEHRASRDQSMQDAVIAQQRQLMERQQVQDKSQLGLMGQEYTTALGQLQRQSLEGDTSLIGKDAISAQAHNQKLKELAMRQLLANAQGRSQYEIAAKYGLIPAQGRDWGTDLINAGSQGITQAATAYGTMAAQDKSEG